MCFYEVFDCNVLFFCLDFGQMATFQIGRTLHFHLLDGQAFRAVILQGVAQGVTVLFDNQIVP